MKALRASLVAIGPLTLSAATLSAQSTRISCKDGSKPKIGHFACWGHGGLVREAGAAEPVKAAPKAKPAKPSRPSLKKRAVKNPAAKKPAAKKSATASRKKKSSKTPTVRPVRNSAK